MSVADDPDHDQTGAVPVRLVLASSSPRRHDLLAGAGYSFDVRSPAVAETRRSNEPAEIMVMRLALTKAAAIEVPHDTIVVGCDTTVVHRGEVLGKPDDAATAVTMLLRIQDDTHTVHTGVAVVGPRGRTSLALATTEVEMQAISESEAIAYAATGEPLDKAGSYAYQGEGRRFVARVTGSTSNVMGLPLESVTAMLERRGVRPAPARE